MQFSKKKYSLDWVLINELAISQAPRKLSDLKTIEREGIISILTLCAVSEVKLPEELETMFYTKRIVLPDHKYKRNMNIDEINKVLDVLSELLTSGPVLVHCVAAVERSPLICMGWLIRNKGLSLQEALDYLMQIHPRTSPLSSQIKILNSIKKDS